LSFYSASVNYSPTLIFKQFAPIIWVPIGLLMAYIIVRPHSAPLSPHPITRRRQSMKVAVFGKPGGGKSTLSLNIAKLVSLPLHQLDLIQFAEGGVKVPDEIFLRRHSKIVASERWVIDGFGTPQSFETLMRAADVLVYVDRAPIVHYWWVTKRFIKSPFSRPVGWPKGSPMLRSTLDSYRFLRLSHKFWSPAFREKLLALQPEKRVFIVARQSDVKAMLRELQL
jgi:adenylate kinase family enzyme